MIEEEEPNWFTRWEEELPSPEELMPLSQTLITPDLALAFDIPSPNPSVAPAVNQPVLGEADFDAPDQSSPAGAGSSGDEPARTLKRPRLVWTPQLHKRFVDAVAHLGIKNAVPKTIMQLMSVDGLTRENVASHLQKYRLYLKRMQGLSSSAAGSSCAMSPADAATEQLFASNPIPHPFLARAASGPAPESFMQFMSPPLLQHHQHLAAATAMAQQQFYRHRHMGHFGQAMASGGGGYDNGFRRGAAPVGARGMGNSGLGLGISSTPVAPSISYGEDIDSGSARERRILTLFPTGSED